MENKQIWGNTSLLNSGHVAFEALIGHAGGDVEQEGIYWIYWSGAQKRGQG